LAEVRRISSARAAALYILRINKTCLKKWLTALRTGHEYLVEFRLKFQDGQYRWHLPAVPLIENGVIKLWLGTNTNIDIRKPMSRKKMNSFLSPVTN